MSALLALLFKKAHAQLIATQNNSLYGKLLLFSFIG